MTDPEIGYRVGPCALGWLLVAGSARGVCNVRLGDAADALVADLHRELAASRRGRAPNVRRNAPALATWWDALCELAAGRDPASRLPLDVSGRPFERRVWRAIRAIPRGAVSSYGQVAAAIGRHGAARAVGAACGANPVALVVPCHRVVRADGETGGYRWGAERKQTLLASEGQRATVETGVERRLAPVGIATEMWSA